MAHPEVTYAPLVIDQHLRARAARRRRLLVLAGVLALLAAGIALFAGGGSSGARSPPPARPSERERELASDREVEAANAADSKASAAVAAAVAERSQPREPAFRQACRVALE